MRQHAQKAPCPQRTTIRPGRLVASGLRVNNPVSRQLSIRSEVRGARNAPPGSAAHRSAVGNADGCGARTASAALRSTACQRVLPLARDRSRCHRGPRRGGQRPGRRKAHSGIGLEGPTGGARDPGGREERGKALGLHARTFSDMRMKRFWRDRDQSADLWARPPFMAPSTKAAAHRRRRSRPLEAMRTAIVRHTPRSWDAPPCGAPPTTVREVGRCQRDEEGRVR